MGVIMVELTSKLWTSPEWNYDLLLTQRALHTQGINRRHPPFSWFLEVPYFVGLLLYVACYTFFIQFYTRISFR